MSQQATISIGVGLPEGANGTPVEFVHTYIIIDKHDGTPPVIIQGGPGNTAVPSYWQGSITGMLGQLGGPDILNGGARLNGRIDEITPNTNRPPSEGGEHYVHNYADPRSSSVAPVPATPDSPATPYLPRNAQKVIWTGSPERADAFRQAAENYINSNNQNPPVYNMFHQNSNTWLSGLLKNLGLATTHQSLLDLLPTWQDGTKVWAPGFLHNLGEAPSSRGITDTLIEWGAMVDSWPADAAQAIGIAGKAMLANPAIGSIWYTNAAAIRLLLNIFYDPLVIDMGGDGLHLSDISESKTLIRVDNDSFVHVAWIGQDDVLVFSDVDGDDIASRAEILGLESGNGWTDLESLDDNGDGIINISDAAWHSLRGMNALGAVTALADLGITSIDVSHTAYSVTSAGNLIDGKTKVNLSNGQTRDMYDVFLAADPSETLHVPSISVSDWNLVRNLPTMHGFGELSDLRISAATDGVLRQNLSSLVGTDGRSNIGTVEAVKQIEDLLFTWGNSSSELSSSRGEFFDARKLGFMEKYYARDFIQEDGTSAPNALAGPMLDMAWSQILRHAIAAYAIQTDLIGDVGIQYNLDEDVFSFTSSGLDQPARYAVFDAHSSVSGLHELSLFWVVALSILDAVTPINTSDVDALLSSDGMDGMGSALRNPILLPAAHYHHRPSGDALIVASDTGNVIDAGMGDHVILGGAGNDDVRVNTGSNIISLAGGTNTLNYDLFFEHNSINLETGITTRASGTDKISGINVLITGLGGDDVIGSSGADVIYAANFGYNGLVENIRAGAGDDIVYSWHPFNSGISQGPVNIWGEDGNDTLHGNRWTNSMDGGSGDDIIWGYDGNDVMIGGQGDDVISGGVNVLEGDYDILDYRADPDGIVADLRTTTWSTLLQRNVGVVTDGWGDTDQVVDVERILGSMFDDVIQAPDGVSFPYGAQNRGVDLFGMGGDDVLIGGTGQDWLDGGAGADIMTGGAGADRFRIAFASDGAGDVIIDFTPGEDLIVLGKDQGSEWEWPGYYGAFPENRWARNEGGHATVSYGQMIQDSLTGNLYWDADGTGAGASVQIASFSTNVELTRFDVHVL